MVELVVFVTIECIGDVFWEANYEKCGTCPGLFVDYEVVVRTTDKKKASTRNHAFIQLVGNRGTSKPEYMVNKTSDRLFKN